MWKRHGPRLWIDSNLSFPRLTAARMRFGREVHAVKVSMAATLYKGDRLVAHVQALPGNAYDGHSFRRVAGKRPVGTAGTRSGERFAAKAMVPCAASSNDGAAVKIAVRRIGPALVFERAVGGDRLPDGGHEARGQAQIRLLRWNVWTCGGPHDVAPVVCERSRPCGRSVDRWREDYAVSSVEGFTASSLPGDGTAG
jgi:hypothetical protein